MPTSTAGTAFALAEWAEVCFMESVVMAKSRPRASRRETAGTGAVRTDARPAFA
jgi:hypothetical protein